MAEALRLDILIDEDGRAQAALIELYRQFRAAGDSAIEAAEKVEKFEKSYKDTAAKKEAARALDGVVKSTRQAGEAADTASAKTARFGGVIDELKSAALRYAAPAAMGAAILKTIEWADSIGDAAERTRLTTTQVQQLSKMAEKNGSSFQQMAGLIQVAEQRLASHNSKAEEAVKLMGMAPEKLLALNPLERLRAIAKGLADIEDPAKRSALEVDILGRSSDEASVALNKLAEGADEAETALGSDFIEAGNKAQDVLDKIKTAAMDAVRSIVLVGPAIVLQAKQLDEARKIGKLGPVGTQAPGVNQQIGAGALSDLIGQRISAEQNALANPTMPSSPNFRSWLGFPSPLGVPGSPMNGAAGQSWGFLNRTTPAGRASGGAKVLPFSTRTSYLGSAAATIFALKNTPGSFSAGSLPFRSSPGLLESSGSPLDFMNGMQLPGGVSMNAPGGGGGLGGWLKNNKARVGIGLGTMAAGYLGSRIGGKAGGALSGAAQGAQMGMMFGPWGAAVGGVIGGVAGWIGAGKKAKNAKNAETSQVFEQFSSKEFIDLQKQADRLGISLQKALTSKTMKDFTAATEEAAKKVKELVDLEDQIASLKEQSVVTFDQMNSIVSEFGLDVSKIGPAFQQALTDKEAQRIIDAMAVMEKGGADMNGVLDGMADEINGVVLDSIKFGTTIPKNMQPWIQKLIEAGKLTDENGTKITDMSGLKFGDEMKSELDKVATKLGELIDKLKELTDKFRGATGAATDLSNVNYPDPGGSGSGDSGGSGPGVWRGGVVGDKGNILYFKRGGFVPHGTDTVPAMLTPGEMVLARDQVKAMTKRGAGRSITVNMNIAGYLDSPKVQRELARVVQDAIDGDVRSVRVG